MYFNLGLQKGFKDHKNGQFLRHEDNLACLVAGGSDRSSGQLLGHWKMDKVGQV